MSAAACPYRSRRSSRAFFVSGPLYQLLATRRRTPTGWAESSEDQIPSWATDVARPAGSIRGIRSRCGQDSQTGPHGGLQAVLGPLGRSLGAVRRYRRPAIADDGRPLWRVGVHKTPAYPHNRYVNAHCRIWAEVRRGTAQHMQPGGDGAPGRRCGWDVMVRAWALNRGCSCLIVLLASGSAKTYKPK